jgi:hypothetical protein
MLEAVPLKQQVRKLPKLWPREQYIQTIANLHAVAQAQGWSHRRLGRAKYEARKQMWRRMLRDPKLDPAWLAAWDKQIAGLLRKGVKPQQVSDLMVAQAYFREYGVPQGLV